MARGASWSASLLSTAGTSETARPPRCRPDWGSTYGTWASESRRPAAAARLTGPGGTSGPGDYEEGVAVGVAQADLSGDAGERRAAPPHHLALSQGCSSTSRPLARKEARSARTSALTRALSDLQEAVRPSGGSLDRAKHPSTCCHDHASGGSPSDGSPPTTLRPRRPQSRAAHRAGDRAHLRSCRRHGS